MEDISQRQHDVIMSLSRILRPATAGAVAAAGGLGDARGVAQTFRAAERGGYTEKRKDGYMLTRKGLSYVRKHMPESVQS